MKPIRLTLQAFGPFAETQVVDFRAVMQTGLFGIYGPTGAGKSTLFSAMAFALYGAPTKSEQEPRSLRSDHAAPDLPTQVELIFELGEKTYLVRRRPAQSRPKTRGEGSTEDAAMAWLFDVTGIAPEDLGPDITGRVIAEKQVSQVGKEIEALLGYGINQFRQIVLLPQGKFETFLAADSSARLEILRDLFDVQIYRALAERLRVDAKDAIDQVKQQRALFAARLQDHGFETPDDLDQGIAIARAQRGERRMGQKQAQDADTAARQGLTAMTELAKAFDSADHARRQVAALEEKSADMDRLSQRVERVSKAAKARDLETAMLRAHSDVDAAIAAMKKAEETLNTARQAADDATQGLERARLDEGRIQTVQAEQAQLEAIKPQVAQTQALQDAVVTATRERDSAVSALTRATHQRKALQTQQETTDAALEQARQTASDRSALQQALTTAQQQRRIALDHAKAQAAVAEATKACTDAETTLSDALGAEKRAAQRLSDAEAQLSRTQAIILAEKLQDGAPCPVCGACDHPSPAQGSIQHAGQTEAFRVAQSDAQRAREARVRAESALDSSRARRAERADLLAEQPALAQSLAEIDVEIERLNSGLKALGQAVDLDALSDTLNGLKRQVADATRAEESARDTATLKETALAQTCARRDTVLGTLPEGLRTPQAVEQRLHTLSETLSRLQTALTHAQQADQTARDTLTRAQERLSAAKDTLAKQRTHAQSCKDEFDARLHDLGLERAQYDACKPLFATLEADRRVIERHRSDLIEARTTLKNALAACGGHERPDLRPFQQARDDAAAALEAANAALAQAESRVKSLTEFKESLVQARTKTERLEADTRALRGLAAMTNGDNDLKLTLETFAIGAMFDQVLQAANDRLNPMTQGRYHLSRKLEASGGRRKRGLEIDVFDINTGKPRAAATLSGGESFIAALALALGLADVVERHSGRVRMDTIFIDEGFGSLDSEGGTGTLDTVLQVLAALTQGSRTVGLISHVALVQEAIPEGFYVRSSPAGSRVETRSATG